MKKTFSLLLFASLIVSVHAQFNAEKTPLITKSLAENDVKSILSETSDGSISVAGVAGAEAKIEVYVVPNNYRKNDLSEKEIRDRMASDYKLTIWVDNNHKLTATAKPVDRNMNWKNALNFSFKIFVPKNVSTDLTTSGGSIHLIDLNGIQHFTTSGGSLHADKLKGNIKGRTSGGSIHVKDCNDDIDLTTSGGSIEADNCTGKIRLVTSGGSLDLSNLNGNIAATTSGGSVYGELIKGELEAHTSGGNIDMKKLSCNLVTSTSGGNIDIEITELGKYAKISNSGGNIDVQLPNKGLDLKVKGSKIKTNNFSHFSGSVEDDEINGKLNGGGIPVTIIANSGRVNLVLK